MDIDNIVTEKIKRLEDIKNQLMTLSKQIGGLNEQQRALYNQGLELKGSIDGLMELKQKTLENSKTAGLILPVGTAPVSSQTVDSAQTQVVPAAPVILTEVK